MGVNVLPVMLMNHMFGEKKKKKKKGKKWRICIHCENSHHVMTCGGGCTFYRGVGHLV